MIYKTKVNDNVYIFDGSTFELYKNKIDDTNEIRRDDKIVRAVPRRLEKLDLIITTQCNGECLYCYQNREYFGHTSPLMDKKSADRILDYLTLNYDKIANVNFFGGEPTLNFKIMKYLTENLRDEFSASSFSITSNATLIDDEIIGFLDKFNFNIILSIDGPEIINDKLRKNLKYDKIYETIKLLCKAGLKNNLTLNCTYTKYHEDFFDKNLLSEFFDQLGIAYHISDVITEDSNLKLSEIHDNENVKLDIEQSFDRIINNSKNKDIISYTRDVLEAIIYTRSSEWFCNDVIEGYSETFDTNSKRHHCISLIKEDIDFKKINIINSKNNPVCNNCWARNLCTKCIAQYYLGNEKMIQNINDCKRKRYYEYTIKTLMRIYEASERRFNKIFSNYIYFG